MFSRLATTGVQCVGRGIVLQDDGRNYLVKYGAIVVHEKCSVETATGKVTVRLNQESFNILGRLLST